MNNPTIFNEVLVWPIINVLVGIYQGLIALHIPYALGFSIIVLTIVIRLILYPLTAAQLKSTKKMQSLAPHLNKLKDKHKGDAKMLQAETMKLYKEHGVNPVAGCIPVIFQLPIIWGLYSVLQEVVKTNTAAASINKILYFKQLHLTHIWDQHFFDIPLGQGPSHLIASYGPLILLFPIATAFFQFIQSKMMFVPPPTEVAEEVTGKKINPNDKKAEEIKKQDDFASAFQTQSMYIFPLMIGFFSYNFPIGLTLYWITFTLFGIIQQYRIQGWGGMSAWVAKLKKNKNG